MFAGFPLVALTFVTAEDVVALLLGDQWGEAVLFFRALAPAALVGTMNVAGAWIFVSLGRVDRRMRAVLVHSILVLAAMGIGLHWGAMGVALAYSIAMILLRGPFVAYACHGSPVRLRDVGAALWRPLFFSLLAGAAAALVTARGWAPDGIVLRLLFVTAAYALSYLLLWTVLPGGRAILAGFAAAARRGLGCGDHTRVG
jgi:O-antigen/teichoic acid export membrane protein